MKGKDTKPDVHKTHTSIVLCHEREEKKNCTHTHTNIRTYIEKTTLHCTALHTYRNIYTYTHKVCHGIFFLFVIFAYARCK
jgi:hypothetical protein